MKPEGSGQYRNINLGFHIVDIMKAHSNFKMLCNVHH